MDGLVIDRERADCEKIAGLDPETWTILRWAQQYSMAQWKVKLTCGHFEDVFTDLDFVPGQEPHRGTIERRDELRRELEAPWAEEGPESYPKEGPQHEHMRRMLDLRMPHPKPEQECRSCSFAKKVTGYERIGWLAGPPEPTPPIRLEQPGRTEKG